MSGPQGILPESGIDTTTYVAPPVNARPPRQAHRDSHQDDPSEQVTQPTGVTGDDDIARGRRQRQQHDRQEPTGRDNALAQPTRSDLLGQHQHRRYTKQREDQPVRNGQPGRPGRRRMHE